MLITHRPAVLPQEGFCQRLHKSGLAASLEPSAVLSPDIREDAAVCSSPPPPYSRAEGLCSAGKYDKIQGKIHFTALIQVLKYGRFEMESAL